MSLRPAVLALLALSLPVAAHAQDSAGRPNLLGLSPKVQDLLIEADRKGKDAGLLAMLDAARDSQLVALEADPIDLVRLNHAMESERVINGLLLGKQHDAMRDAFLQMTPAERKTFAGSSRKLREAQQQLKAKQAEAGGK